MRRRIQLIDVIAFLACVWVTLGLLTQGRDPQFLIEVIKESFNAQVVDDQESD